MTAITDQKPEAIIVVLAQCPPNLRHHGIGLTAPATPPPAS
jgi:hypothetical protein